MEPRWLNINSNEFPFVEIYFQAWGQFKKMEDSFHGKNIRPALFTDNERIEDAK
jgi:hypothetical protein